MKLRIKIKILIAFLFLYFIFQLYKENRDLTNKEPIEWFENKMKKFTTFQEINIYFVKTHKTASSALQNVLIRLADKKNMRVVTDIMKESFLGKKKSLNTKIFFFHGRHNYKMATEAFPRDRSIYLTILRNPEDQLLSSINYFMGLRDQKNKILKNIENEHAMKSLGERNKIFCLLKNSVSYDLGYVGCGESYNNSAKILINRSETEFDLVILKEYFNEGLILLKKFLNLSFKDIVCLSVNQGTKRAHQSDRKWVKKVISKVSRADIILYNYYLERYKILSKYFKKDLEILRALNEFYQNRCTDGREKKFFYANVPYIGYSLKNKLKGTDKDYCWKLTSTELEMIDYITKKSEKTSDLKDQVKSS